MKCLFATQVTAARLPFYDCLIRQDSTSTDGKCVWAQVDALEFPKLTAKMSQYHRLCYFYDYSLDPDYSLDKNVSNTRVIESSNFHLFDIKSQVVWP